MKRTLMIGVAAGALLAGVNLAAAQYGASGGASIEQKGSAKAQSGETKAKGGTEMKAQGGAELKGGKAKAQSGGELKAQGGAEMKGGKAKAQGGGELKAQGGAELKGGKAKAQSGAEMKGDKELKGGKARAQAGGEMKAQEPKKGEKAKAGTSAQGETKAGGSATTGQGSAGGGAKASLTTEQKTKIRETVFKSGPRVTNVNFSLSVGTVVPRTVRFATLPPILVEIYPQWRGYEYFIVEEEIIIVEPRTLKIVAIIRV
jgi:hypothetical protein